MKHLFSLSISILLLNLATGCNILSFKINSSQFSTLAEISQSKAMTPKLIVKRQNRAQVSSVSKIQDFAKLFSSEVEKSANLLVTKAASQQERNQALRWQSSTDRNLKQIMTQSNMQKMLLDTWVYTKRMEYFFSVMGQGKALFGHNQYIALNTAKKLNLKIEAIAKGALKNATFTQMKLFVASNARTPLSPFLVFRTNYNQWLIVSHKKAASKISTYNPATEISPAPKYLVEADNNKQEVEHLAQVIAVEKQPSEVIQLTKTEIKAPKPKAEESQNTGYANTEDKKQTVNISDSPAAMSEDMLGGLVSFASNLQGNILINKHLNTLADKITGNSEAPLTKDIVTQTIPKLEKYVEQSYSSNKDVSGIDDNIHNTHAIDIDKEELQSMVDNATNKFLTNLPSFFPNAMYYLYIGLLAIFLIPFLLGYFIGRKRQDPNFTVISTADRRKSINQPAA